MSEQDANVNAPAQEIAETNADDTSEKTLGDLLKTETPSEEPKSEAKHEDSVPVAKFLAEKKTRKALEKRVKELEEAVNAALEDDDVDVSKEVKDLAEEYGVDSKFLKNLTTTLEKKLEDKFEKKLEPLTREKKQNDINTIFTTHFNETIGSMPEYEAIVNPDVIKSLSLDPANSNLTLRQLIEKTYGNALGGKRTIETTVPNGGKEPQEINYDRAQSDPDYYKEIMSNESSKKKYNEQMVKRLQGIL